jgi:hypothetical protein
LTVFAATINTGPSGSCPLWKRAVVGVVSDGLVFNGIKELRYLRIRTSQNFETYFQTLASKICRLMLWVPLIVGEQHVHIFHITAAYHHRLTVNACFHYRSVEGVVNLMNRSRLIGFTLWQLFLLRRDRLGPSCISSRQRRIRLLYRRKHRVS